MNVDPVNCSRRRPAPHGINKQDILKFDPFVHQGKRLPADFQANRRFDSTYEPIILYKPTQRPRYQTSNAVITPPRVSVTQNQD